MFHSAGLPTTSSSSTSPVYSSPTGSFGSTSGIPVNPLKQAMLSGGDSGRAVESGLSKLVRAEGLLHTGTPLAQLRDFNAATGEIRLAIDGVMLLDQITHAVQQHDPLAVFTSGLSPVICHGELPALQRKMQAVQAALPSGRTLRPVLITGGLTFLPGLEPQIPEVMPEPRYIQGYHLAETNEAGQCVPAEMTAQNAPNSVRRHAASRFRVTEDAQTAIAVHLKAHGMEVVRAPYFPWPQISACLLPSNAYLSEVYGSLEMLAFPCVTRVVTAIHEDRGCFDYVVKEEVMTAARRVVEAKDPSLHFGADEFDEWVLMDSLRLPYVLDFIPPDLQSLVALVMAQRQSAGSPTSPALPVSEQENSTTPHSSPSPPYSHPASFTPAEPSTAPIRPSNSLTHQLLQITSGEQRRRLNCNLAILDAPTFTQHAMVQPLFTLYGSHQHSEMSLSQVIGAPLPPILFAVMAAGLLLPSVLTAASQNTIVNRMPLIDSALLRTVTKRLLSVRMLAAEGVRYSYGQYGSPTFCYQEAVKKNQGTTVRCTPLNRNQLPFHILSEHWPVCGNPTINHPHTVIDFHTVMLFASNHIRDEGAFEAATEAAAAAVTSRGLVCDALPTTTTVPELAAMVLLKTLDSLGYFIHEEDGPLEPSLWGSFILETPLSFPPNVTPAYQASFSESIVLMVDLIRSGALNDAPISICVSLPEDRVYPTGFRLASRLLSLVPFTTQKFTSGPGAPSAAVATWSGPLDPEIAAFHGVTRTLMTALKEKLEGVAAAMYTSSGSTLVTIDEAFQVTQRLPFSSPSDFYGGVVVLYVLIHFITNGPGLTCHELKRVFPECTNLAGDLTSCLDFWRRAMHIVSPQRATVKEVGESFVMAMTAVNGAVEAALTAVLCPR